MNLNLSVLGKGPGKTIRLKKEGAMFAVFAGIAIGFGLAVQTAINSQLRKFVVSPFLASMISFLVGTVFLAAATAVSRTPLGVPAGLFLNQPVWIWFGGICGVIGLTSNILLFPKLGSVQTTVMPILGMILMGMLIDQFGWFHSIRQSFGINRAIGVFLVLAGVVFAVVVPEAIAKRHSAIEEQKGENIWIWRLLGIAAGMIMAVQAAINGKLGTVLHSPVHASFISFFVGSVVLVLIVGIKDRSFTNIKEPVKQSAPWWVWLGGIIGGLYILINVFLVDHIGTGQTVILALFGQIAGSLVVERFGLFKSLKRRIVPVQILGLVIMLSGVILIKMF
ncbi:hypothetical protein B4099_1892 [Heyndrickxia coagulans]|uniref:Integral membrane protein n=2 Tax=Heyndrickxia coagulans TaxID=1398 RepID=A0A150K0U4_HEYCO|nr:hypothetical protein B4099_1892 [Heyndrickxia coagulans]